MTARLPELGRFYLPFIALAVLSTLFGGYFFFYVRHQEEYHSRRNLRELAVVAEQLQAQVGTYRTVLKTRADYIQKWFSDKAQTDSRKYLEELECFQEAFLERDGPKQRLPLRVLAQACLAKPYIDNRVPNLAYVDPRDDPPGEELSLVLQDGEYWLYLFAESDKELEVEPRGKVRIHAKARLRELGSKFVPAGQFDNVLFVDDGGTVLFQSTHPELRATGLPQVTTEGRNAATGVIEETLGGTSYKIFIQPVRLPVAMADAAEPAAEAEQDGEQEDESETDASPSPAVPKGRHWVVCGLVETERFRAETQAISYSVIIWFVFLLLMTMFLWPFFKLRALAPAERLPRWEGFSLLLATLLGSAALTVAVTDLYYFEQLNARLDRRLEAVAAMIDRNVGIELERVARQLGRYDEVRQSRGYCGETARVSMGSLLQELGEDETGFYPFFDMVFWAAQDGTQLMKWSARGEPTTSISVEQREYFRRVREARGKIRDLALLEPTEDAAEEDLPREGRFWLDSIYSWTTGVNQAAFSMRVDERSCQDRAGRDFRLGAVMAAGVMRPQSLMEPVLPAGFGFAVVNRGGDVLFHSDLTRLLIENFIAESDGDRELQSAIQGGIKKNVQIRYAGRNHRAFVQPLSRIKGLPWALIVFHPMGPLRTANLEVLTCTFFLFLLYLGLLLIGVYAAFAVACRSLRGFFARDAYAPFWPDRKITVVYWQLVTLYIVLIVLLGGWTVFAEGARLAAAACVIPLYGFLLALRALRHGQRRHRSRGPTVDEEQELLKGFPLWKWSAPFLVAVTLLWLVMVDGTSWRAPLLLCLGLAAASLPLALEPAWRKLHRSTERENLKPYLFALTLSFVLFSVLPCLAFFKVAFVLERELMVDRGQIKLARALEARSERVRIRYKSVATATSVPKEDFLQRRLNDEDTILDVYADFSKAGGSNEETSGEKEPSVEDAAARACDPWIPCVTFGPIHPEESSSAGDPLRMLFRTIRPLYDDFAGETWTLLHPSSLHSTRQGDELRLRHAYVGDHGVEITSLLPYMRLPGHPLAWIVWLLAALGIYGCIYGAARLIARNIFLLDIVPPPSPSALLEPPEVPGHNLFILSQPFSKKSAVLHDLSEDTDGKIHVVGWAEIGRGEKKLKSKELPSKKVIFIDQLEYEIDDPAWNREKLRLLEELIYVRRKKKDVPNSSVVIVSSVDPVFYATTGGSGKPQSGAELGDDLDRWTAVLSSFEIVDYKGPAKPKIEDTLKKFTKKVTPDSPDPKALERLCDQLKSECGPNIALRHIAADLVTLLPKGKLPRGKQLGDMIYDRCEAYYRLVWASCSKAEKLMLIHLAEEGYVNRKNERVLQQLLRKALIVREPRLALMNETFKRFVLDARRHEDVAQWEQEGTEQGWVVWRSVLVVVLVMLIGFLTLTQREILESWVPILGAFAGGLAGLLRLIGMFRAGPLPVAEARE